jgi:hypothetical protein
MKKKLLIINKIQFGYHTDTFKYCQYLKDEFDITYICFDAKEIKINDGLTAKRADFKQEKARTV